MMLYILIFIVWYLIGAYSFYYWWTKTEDLTTNSKVLFTWFKVGFLGVFTWFIGWGIDRYIDNPKPIKEEKVLFKKRK